MAKTKKELEAENKALKKKVAKLEDEMLKLQGSVAMLKELVKESQTKIPNYNLYPGRLGISQSDRRIC